MVEQILQTKRSGRSEFFVNLFELCNLRCSFCWQDHESTVGLDTVRSKVTPINQKVIAISKTKKIIDLNVMGGELFFDEIDDGLFEDYFYFATEINRTALSTGVEVNFNWVTNLVFTKIDRVFDLLARLRREGIYTYLTTSYDPRGRFNKKNKELFFRNLEMFKSELKMISVVLTKPNIEFFLQRDDTEFQYLYDNFNIYFDFYSPEENHRTMAVTDKELRDFFFYVIRKYPRVYPVTDWINKLDNKMSCRTSNVVTPSGNLGKCRLQVAEKLTDNFNSKVNLENNHNMEESFLEKYNCLQCEYFQRCSLGCFLQEDYKSYNELDECMMKQIYQYIEKNHAL